MNKLAEVEKESIREGFPKFGPGDTLRVSFRIHEGKKDKIQAFQGVCIQIRGAGSNHTFTLRKISQAIGVERIFPYHSPLIEKIEVVRYGKVRRAKLYYLRDKVGKARTVKERIVRKTETEKKKRRSRRKKNRLVASEAKVLKTAVQQEEVVQETPVPEEAVEKVPAETSPKEVTDAAAVEPRSEGVEKD